MDGGGGSNNRRRRRDVAIAVVVVIAVVVELFCENVNMLGCFSHTSRRHRVQRTRMASERRGRARVRRARVEAQIPAAVVARPGEVDQATTSPARGAVRNIILACASVVVA